MRLAAILLAAITVMASCCCGAQAQTATATSVSAASTDPQAEFINEEAFKTKYLIAGEEVGQMAALSDSIEEDSASFVDVDTSGNLIARPRPIKCKDGPIKTIFRKPGFWYLPVIKVKQCAKLSCPNNSPCLARRTITRNVWAICYKRFYCWGLIFWIPISVQRLCVVDELDCECKQCSDITSFRECINTKPCPNETCNCIHDQSKTFCYWKPCKLPHQKYLDYYSALSENASTTAIESSIIHPKLWGECACCRVTPCPYGQFFDKRTCQCRCKKVICIPPKFQDPDTCYCVCPKTFDCGPYKKWNPTTCKCECKKVYCFPPRYFDPQTCKCKCPHIRCSKPYVPDPSSCKCQCPKDIVCYPPKFLNKKTCKCQCPPKICPQYHVQDPYTCECVCRRVCPDKAYLDTDTCKCVGDCADMLSATACNLTDSCKNNMERSCRWFKSYTSDPDFCDCDCCIHKFTPPTNNVDCSFNSPWGPIPCNLADYNTTTQQYPCEWKCQ